MEPKGLCPPANGIDEVLKSKMIEHEGMKQFAYTDTQGFITVGIGRCLDSRKGKGLTVEECFMLLNNDIEDLKKRLSKFPWYTKQNYVRQGVLIEMAFNLGIDGLLGFKRMITCLNSGNVMQASAEMSDSKWAAQISPTRLSDMKSRMRLGYYK